VEASQKIGPVKIRGVEKRKVSESDIYFRRGKSKLDHQPRRNCGVLEISPRGTALTGQENGLVCLNYIDPAEGEGEKRKGPTGHVGRSRFIFLARSSDFGGGEHRK